MNKYRLVEIMKRNGDTQEKLANVVGLSLTRFNMKLNETGGAEFTQGEIQAMKQHYDLSPEEIDEIFFAKNVS